MRFRLLQAGCLVALAMGGACALSLDGYAGDPITADAGQTDDAGTPDTFVPGVDASDPNAVYGGLILRDKPVAYFRFDDAPDAGAAVDSIGAHDALASQTGVTFGASGFRGGAVSLAGGDTALDMGNVFNFPGLVPYSFEVWMKPKAGTFDGVLLHKRDESVDPFIGYVFYLGGDRSVHFESWGVDLSAWTNGGIDGAVSATGFSHVVVTVTYADGAGNAAVYIDGRQSGVGGFANTTPQPSTTVDLLLGHGFEGTLDELALYDYALTPAQIDAHFTAGRY